MVEITKENNSKYEELTEYEPESKLVDMAKDGSGVFGLFVGNDIISPIGYMIGFNKEGSKTRSIY